MLSLRRGAATTRFRLCAERAIELLPDAVVALARRCLESAAIDHRDPASAVSNQTRALKRRTGEADRRPPDAEHLRKKLLRERELVSPDTVEGHQQPAAHALLERVRAITRRVLAEHGHYCIAETNELLVKRPVRRLAAQFAQGHPQRRTRDLADRPLVSFVSAEECLHADHTFVSDGASLYLTLPHDDDERDDALLDEVHGVNSFTLLVKHFLELERHFHEVRRERPELVSWQCREDAIADTNGRVFGCPCSLGGVRSRHVVTPPPLWPLLSVRNLTLCVVSCIEQSKVARCKNTASTQEAAHVVVIALSAGGLLPARRLLGRLPWDLPAAVVLVQHLRGLTYLPEILGPSTQLRVKLAEAGDSLRCGTVYVGPPDRHVIVTADARIQIAERTRPRHRPSADWLFESVAGAFGDRAVAVVLSGRLSDGARGAVRVKRAGGSVFAQDPATCQFPDMPIAAIQSGVVDHVLSPDEIAAGVCGLLSARNIAGDANDWREPFAAELTA